MELVAGGVTPAQAAAAASCKGLPASTSVTITTQLGASVGYNASFTTSGTTVAVTTTCGALTSAAAPAPAASAPAPAASSSTGGGGGSAIAHFVESDEDSDDF